MFSSPTAIRLPRKQNPEYVPQHDVRCWRILFLAGEPPNESTSNWTRDALVVPIIDNYWQTETESPILALPASTLQSDIKPRSPSLPSFGYRATIVDPEAGENGSFLILGRTEGVIKVAGHRIGTREIEKTIYS